MTRKLLLTQESKVKTVSRLSPKEKLYKLKWSIKDHKQLNIIFGEN